MSSYYCRIMFSKFIFCIWLYFILLTLIRFVQTRRNFTYQPKKPDGQLHFLGFLNDKLYLRDKLKIHELDPLALSLVSSARVCASPCNPNSIMLLNSIKNAILVCDGSDNSFCSVRNISDFRALINANSDGGLSSVSVAVSSSSSRPAIGIVTDDGAMYVAVTYGPGIKTDRYGGNLSFHETYKFVISRIQLNGKILSRDKSLPFRLPKNVELDDYLIFFKGVFKYQGQIFFSTNQKFKVGGNQNYTSKLISICKADPYFYSYTDIVLDCKHKDKHYNLIQDIHVFKPDFELTNEFNLNFTANEDVLAGIFASGDDPDHPEPSSAVCLYSFKEIRDKLREARERFIMCPGSNLTENERYLDNNIQGACHKEKHFDDTPVDFGQDCNKTWPFFSYVIGEVVLSSDPVFVLASTEGRLTKMFVQPFKDVTFGDESIVLYAGTSAGKLLTMTLVSYSSVTVFDEIAIDPGHPIEAIHVDEEHNIFAMSNQKLVKYGVFDCERYESCDSFTGSFNPFCGWCVYQSRSIFLRNSTCQNMHKPNHLLPYSGTCASLAMTLNSFEVGKITQIFFHVETFPEPLEGDEYYCQFKHYNGAQGYVSTAKRGENVSFTCNTPIVSRHSKTVLELLVSTTSGSFESRHNVTLANSSILFYDCRYFTRCRECTGNRHHKCTWYLKEGQCKSKNDSGTRSTNVSEASSCPYVRSTISKVPFTHANVPTKVFVEVANVYEFMELHCCIRGYTCSPAKFVNASMIQCTVQVNTNTSLLTLPLQIKYAGHFLNGTQNNKVTVYNCRHLVNDCSECRALDTTKFKCFWCHSGHSNYCGYSGDEECVLVDNCPPPVITKIFPNTAPVYGGTIVTITGQEIGTSPESISTIKLAGITCNLLPDKYVVSKTAVCEAGDASNFVNNADFRGQVQITVYNITSSSLTFTYKIPELANVLPVSGPQAGGTVMTISGRNLDIGNRKIVICFVTDDDRRSCDNSSVVKTTSATSDHHIEILMPPAGEDTEFTSTEVTFDDNTRKKIATTYVYLEDPVIETIYPKKSISSGGIKVTVFGRQLTNANNVKILISYRTQTKFRKCIFKSDKQAICWTPSVFQVDRSFERNAAADSSIHLDGVTKTFILEYVIDPQIGTTDFVNTSTILDVIHGNLFIEGRNLTLAATLSDIRVKVGQAGCPIISVNETQIQCLIPKEQPPGHGKVRDSLLQVNVTIGDLHKLVGYIHYTSDVTNEGSGFITVVILSSLIGLLGLIVMVVAIRSLKVCARKSRERLRYLSMYQIGGNDTPILPSRERRHSNGNIYEVINDLQLVDGRTRSEDTHDDTDNLKKIEYEEPCYQSLDNSPKSERGTPFHLFDNPSDIELVPLADLNSNGSDDNSDFKKTHTDYYLSPVMLKEAATKEK